MGMGMTDEDLVLHDDLEQLTNLVTSSIEQPMVVLGDLILDRYIHGYANNLNSRAPVPVLVETERHQNVGAAKTHRTRTDEPGHVHLDVRLCR